MHDRFFKSEQLIFTAAVRSWPEHVQVGLYISICAMYKVFVVVALSFACACMFDVSLDASFVALSLLHVVTGAILSFMDSYRLCLSLWQGVLCTLHGTESSWWWTLRVPNKAVARV